MYGAQIGTLNVYIKSGGSTSNIFTNQGNNLVAKGAQELWLYHSFTVTNTLQWSVIFEGKSL